MGKNLQPERESLVRFWNEMVLSKSRKPWQIDQWLEAGRWYLNWLVVCKQHGRVARSVPERMKAAVLSAGARRGLALNTRRRYAGCMARFGAWVGGARAALDVGRGTAWLAHLVEVEELSFSSQKVALNALVFFYRDVCGKDPEEIDLQVKLRKTGERIPVVMSRDEVASVISNCTDSHNGLQIRSPNITSSPSLGEWICNPLPRIADPSASLDGNLHAGRPGRRRVHRSLKPDCKSGLPTDPRWELGLAVRVLDGTYPATFLSPRPQALRYGVWR